MATAVLTLNAGSSSIKFALFALTAAEPRLHARGQIEGIGGSPHLRACDERGALLTERRWPAGSERPHEAFLAELLGWVDDHLDGDELIGVGHRIVHGGAEFDRPIVVSGPVRDKLAALSPLAPLHQPHNLAALDAASSVRPDLAQVACFDTAFHHGLPAVAIRFGLPREFEKAGVRRYGFHGLSYEYIARQLEALRPATSGRRVIAAHLGNGASLCAMRDGVSLETTMGFTAVDGLLMGTRTGTLDPGVVLYLLQTLQMNAAEIEDLIYRRSGLLGVSGISSDMRLLLASREPGAREAIELFVYRIAREAGALVSALGGLDAFVFTGGIGENASQIRAAACERLAWLGVKLDPVANDAGAAIISASESSVLVHVIPTDEERMIAIHTIEVIGAIR